MTRSPTLPVLRATLADLFPGQHNAYKRMTIRRTAETFTDRYPDLLPSSVYDEVVTMHKEKLRLGEGKRIYAAIEQDLAQKTDDGPFKRACHDAGITKKGEKLAKAVWDALPAMFAAVPPDVDPWETMDVIIRLARCKAADITYHDQRMAAQKEKR